MTTNRQPQAWHGSISGGGFLMKDEPIRQPESQTGVKVKKEFVKPELRREAELPKITNAFIGSFNP
jgi:hypothetical protein